MTRARRGALLFGCAAVAAVALLLGISQPAVFFHAYLVGYLFLLGITLGSLGLLMLLLCTGGHWVVVVRRPLEAAIRTLPLLALLFLPIAIGVSFLYPWTHDAVLLDSGLLRHKRPYLNVPFFLLRAVFYFAVWLGMAALIGRWSRAQDDSADPLLEHRLRTYSAPGLVVYGLTVTFAFIDWVMTLFPEWYSTIFGLIFIAGQGISATAFLIITAVLLSRRAHGAGLITTRHIHSLGKILLAFVMIWAYVSFAQWLITWAGNLPEEVLWYTPRLRGGWQEVGLLLIIAHFAVPFVLLLSADIKRSSPALSAIAGFLLAMRLLECFWLVRPALQPGRLHVHALDLLLPITLLGLWLALFVFRLGERPLLPRGSPSLPIEQRRVEGEA